MEALLLACHLPPIAGLLPLRLSPWNLARQEAYPGIRSTISTGYSVAICSSVRSFHEGN
jgi:hypothetical protein